MSSQFLFMICSLKKRVPSYKPIIDLWHQFISITLFWSLRTLVELLEISYFHKCSQQSENDERKRLMLSNGNFMPHMMEYVLKSKISYPSGPRCFPNSGSVRTAKLTCDIIYTRTILKEQI